MPQFCLSCLLPQNTPDGPNLFLFEPKNGSKNFQNEKCSEKNKLHVGGTKKCSTKNKIEKLKLKLKFVVSHHKKWNLPERESQHSRVLLWGKNPLPERESQHSRVLLWGKKTLNVALYKLAVCITLRFPLFFVYNFYHVQAMIMAI